MRLTNKHQYTCQPVNKYGLKSIIIERIKNEGNACDLNDIDTSKITDMSNLFDASKSKGHPLFKDFNGDISMWDVSNVTDMVEMFFCCEKFNCDISRWDVSKVKDIYAMFFECKNFNCDLSKWNMPNVKGIPYMFYRCERFNQDLSQWDVSNVENMWFAFHDCPTQPDWYDKDKCEPIINNI